MHNYGDITQIDGWEVPIVDCVIGGSPCQDLSQAGRRLGFNGERSSLFLEQIRLVKEMREHDRKLHPGSDYLARPRYLVWENVRGAFSSNEGQDFRTVLEEIVKIVETDAPVLPMPEKGKWPKYGCFYDDLGKWSIAWRVHDAQFWGVPQRRERIALVADFGGLSAPEVLFEREGLRGYSSQSTNPWKRTAENAKGRPGTDDRAGAGTGDGGLDAVGIVNAIGGNAENYQVCHRLPTLTNGSAPGFQNAVAYTLKIQSGCEGGGKGALVQTDRTPWQSLAADAKGCPGADDRAGEMILSPFTKSHRAMSKDDATTWKDGVVANTLNTFDLGETRSNELVVEKRLFENHSQDSRYKGPLDVSPMLSAQMGTSGNNQPFVVEGTKAYCVGHGQVQSITMDEVANTLNCMHDQQAICIDHAAGAVRTRYIVRRLTPTECERLQGFPDGWTDIGDWTDSKGKKRKTTDSARYKALGNSIALPFWKVLLKRISAQYDWDPTMASLFDGIGGFPYLWEQINGKGSCLWSSEIEEFPIAVTKLRIGETND